jgi:hypothetical protein
VPSENYIAAATGDIADAGSHYERALASRVARIHSELEDAIAAYGQPEALDDHAGKAFKKVYEPAEHDLLALLKGLRDAFKQATDAIIGTADSLARAEEENVRLGDFGRRG